MILQQAYQHLLSQLNTIYDNREATNIANLLLEHITGFSATERIINKHSILNTLKQKQLEQYTQQLLQHIPIQYVLHEAWFLNHKFYVDKNVLIPRPETEELVEWVIAEYEHKKNIPLHIMDVGTGSGCIAISLKNKIPSAQITTIDISSEALTVAKQNALQLKVNIDFLQTDFLDISQWTSLPIPDILISNPPYIPLQEKLTIQKNVKLYEPSTALFVPDNNPLIFYKAIADFAIQYMKPSSLIFVEVHEDYGKDVFMLWKKLGFNTTIKKDMQGKDRMLKVILL